jgi:hypothetical protein
MARNGPRVPRPRRGARARAELSAASTRGPSAPEPPPDDTPAATDDLATVHRWLRGIATDAVEVEELLVEVLRRSRQPAPACLARAAPQKRLQFLTAQAVLRRRGVL